MRVLVVGGAGYIGSHVAREFLDRGWDVTVFDNLSTGCSGNIFNDERFVGGDILDYPALLCCVRQGFDGLVHLAAFKAAGESMVNPEKYSVNNICGTLNILNAACEAGIRHIVFSSSAAVYGEPVSVPIDEEHPTNPENYYGFTKLEIERFLGWYDRLKGVRFAALRYFNAVGYDMKGRVRGLEKNPANLLPVAMEAACGMRPGMQIYGDDYPTPDGTCIRDYVHVSDLADGHVRAMERIRAADQSLTVNLGSENGISVRQIVELARTITGKPIPAPVVARRPGDPARLIASSKKAGELLGWKAKYSDAETILRTTWDVYRKR